MEIISEKVVKTRKSHTCSACGRVFDKGTQMFTQVNKDDTIQTWRECATCMELLSRHRDCFDDGYGVCHEGCVSEALETGQTPEQLLIELSNRLGNEMSR